MAKGTEPAASAAVDQSDDSGLPEDSGVDSSPAPRKRGGMGFLVKALKWVAIGLGALIFIVTIVVVTFNVMNGRGQRAAQAAPQNDSYIAVKPIYATYDGVGNIDTTTADATPYTVTVKPVLEYDQGDNASQGELVGRKAQLIDFFLSYFSKKRAKDLVPENRAKIKEEVKELLNTQVLDKARVRGVLFTQFEVFSQD
jgi:flagellar FliL protein